MTNHSAQQLLRAMKASAKRSGPALGLPVGQPVEAFLRPTPTAAGQLNPDDVHLLSEWRNRFVRSFLTEFVANDDRTSRWLVQTVGSDDTRILFMVDDARRETVGYMGLAFIDWHRGTAEADAIVRGRPAAQGLMSRALLTLLGWAYHALGLHDLRVRVRSDNPALEFFRKLGFDESRRVPLRRIEHPGMVQWLEDPSLAIDEPSLVHMKLRQSRLET